MNSERIKAAQRVYERTLAQRQRDERSLYDFDKSENPHTGHRPDQLEYSLLVLSACAAIGVLVAGFVACRYVWERWAQ